MATISKGAKLVTFINVFTVEISNGSWNYSHARPIIVTGFPTNLPRNP